MNTSNQAVRAARVALLSSCLAVSAMLPQAALAADAVNGQRVYLAHCVGCHGENGRSTNPNAPNLVRSAGLNKPDPVLVDKLRTGSATMPAFLGILQEHDFYDVISYVRTFR